MKIVACIKRVPATETQPAVDASGTRMDSKGVDYMVSFYDEIAVEAAIQAKEAHGGEVTVLTLGPADVSQDMRKMIARGADHGVVLTDADWETRDCRATAKALAAKIQEIGADLVFCGRVATDRDNAAVGPMLATYLGHACVTDVVGLELTGEGGTARRESEAGIESYAFTLPAVITCQKGLNEPRRESLKGIMAAKKKPLDEAAAAAEESQASVTRLELPPARQGGRILGEGADAVPALIDALRNEAQVL